MNSKKDIFTLIFWLILIILEIIFISFLSAIGTIISLIFYGAIAYGIYVLWKKIRGRESMYIIEFISYFFHRLAISILIIFVLFGSFLYYNNEISPAKMPTYYLSNGEKQLTFQSMIHIGSQDFYDTIEQDILFAKQDGYVYFYEGVKPGTPENMQAFNQALGVEFDPELYKNFSELYGVVAQNNSQFLGLHNDKDYNIDMNIDDIMVIYNEKISNKDTSKTKAPINLSSEILDTLSKMSDNQKKVMVYINQGILNFLTKSDGLRNLLIAKLGNQDLFSVILDDRNQVIAQAIDQSDEPRIYATYGLLHFDGVYELLKQKDPNWVLNGVEYLFPIQ